MFSFFVFLGELFFELFSFRLDGREDVFSVLTCVGFLDFVS